MTPTACPSCKIDLRGTEVPEAAQRLFGGGVQTHFSLVEVIRNGPPTYTVLGYRCPACDHIWEKTQRSPSK